MSVADLDLTLRLARRARLLGRLSVDLRLAGRFASLPIVVQDQLQSAEIMAESRARLALWELDRIVWALPPEKAALLVLIKGCAYLLRELPNARGRFFADVDILLPENDLEPVEEILNRRGWLTTKLTPYDQNFYRHWTHELPPLVHHEREVEIDLHHNVVPRTSRLGPDAAEFLRLTQPIENSAHKTLADVDMLLHTMTHMMFDGDLADKLRDLVDVDDLLRHFVARDAAFWDELMARADTMNLQRPAYYSLRYAERLLQCPVPQRVTESIQRWAPPQPILWLMDRIVPRALYPEHPDHPGQWSAICRLLLYMRSHWIRMPPWLLAYHLTYKFCVTRFGKRHGAAAKPGTTDAADVPAPPQQQTIEADSRRRLGPRRKRQGR